jgi:hypothetical protein
MGRRGGAPPQAVKYQIRVRWLAERDLEEAEDWYDEQRSGSAPSFARPSLTSSLAWLQTRRSILRFMARFVVSCCGGSPISFTF